MNKYESVVGIIILDIENNQVIMQLRDNNPQISEPNLWVFPGGGVEKGEMLISALYRECFEELGYKLLDPQSIFSFSKYNSRLKKTFYFFIDTYDQTQKIQCNEGQEIKFIKLSDISKLDRPEYIHLLEYEIKKYLT